MRRVRIGKLVERIHDVLIEILVVGLAVSITLLPGRTRWAVSERAELLGLREQQAV